MYNSLFVQKYDSFMWWNYQDMYFDFICSYTKNFSKILDCGCGTGELLQKFPKNSIKYGIDISSDMLQIAQMKNSEGIFIYDKMQNVSVNEKCSIII